MADVESNGGELVKVDDNSAKVLELLPPEWRLIMTGPQVMTSLDMSIPESRVKVYQALMEDCPKAKQALNKGLEVIDYLMHPCEKANEETGELQRYMRTVLFLSDGMMLAAGSKGIVKSIISISQWYRKPPWNPPLNVSIVNQGTGEKNWYVLLLDWDKERLAVQQAKGKRGK